MLRFRIYHVQFCPKYFSAVYFSSKRQIPREYRHVVTAAPIYVVPNIKFVIISSSLYDSLASQHFHYTKDTRIKEEMNTNSVSQTVCVSSYLPSKFLSLFHLLIMTLTPLSFSLSLSLSFSLSLSLYTFLVSQYLIK